MTTIKEQLYNQCKALLKKKRVQIEDRISLLQTSLTSESKSTAGDKHETGRAMIQLEREKLGNQLKQLEQQEGVLHKIQTTNIKELVALGSYVETDTMSYYLSISLGKLKVEGKEVYAISSQSPIGNLLLGKKEGESITFNGKISKVTVVQ